MGILRCFLFSCFGLLLFNTSQAGTYSGGSGTETSPYKIGTADDWLELVNSSSDWSSSFILISDINLSEVSNLKPIAFDTDSRFFGFQGIAFSGIFDGNGHSIKDVSINMPNDFYIGLFGYIESGGEIRNLELINSTLAGQGFVGGIAGFNKGDIKNCSFDGFVDGGVYGGAGGLVGINEGGTIERCHAEGVVDTWRFMGGVVGINSGTVINCYSMSDVSGIYSSATAYECTGGLIGENSGKVISCYATGSVSGNCKVGGLIGSDKGTVSDCYANGTVLTEEGHSIGGFVGQSDGTIQNCYATGTVSATEDGGME